MHDSMRIYDLLVTGQHVLPLATTIKYIDLLLFQLQPLRSTESNTYKDLAANET